MNAFLNKLERRFGSWAISGLIRYLAILFVGSFLLGGVRPGIGAQFEFNWELILSGQVWRVFTFILAPSAWSFSLIGLVFAYCGLMLMFLFSDSLEAQWGVFRTNLYVLWGFITALLGSIVMSIWGGGAPPFAGVYLSMSIMFAFATYNPQFRLMLFFVIPTPIWIIASITGVMLGFSLLGSSNAEALFMIVCLSNYLFVAIPMRFTEARMARGSLNRRRQFKSLQSEADYFHKCSVCGATDVSHPEAEFRVGHDGEDYCTEHLPE